MDKICATRERTVNTLNDLGYRVLPSEANFIFVSPDKNNSRSAREIFESLNSNNILIRYWDKPGLSDWLRITIGTDEQMDQFFNALQSAA